MADPQQLGPFRVLRRLGRGGMGVVYLVQDPYLPRQVALKLMREEGVSAEAAARFAREAEALAKVAHPNVVRIHEVGRLREGPYLVEEVVVGQPLDEVCGEAPCDPERAARIVAAVAGAVEAVHRAGILHRDLKPSNVILRADDAPVLLDFGLARDLDAETLTRTGDVLGSPSYMAPEQANGVAFRELGPTTDVYGLGTVLYQLLCARPPFVGSTVLVLRAITKDDPPWPAAVVPTVPRELDAICRRALAKAPDERYPTAGALAADLERFLAGEPVEAAAFVTAAQRRRARQRLSLLAGAALGGSALGGVLLAAFVWRPAVEVAPGAEPLAGAPTGAGGARASAHAALWQVAPGEVLHARYQVAERTHFLDFDVEGELRLEVASVDDGVATFAGTVGHLRANMTKPGFSLESFDTRQPKAEHILSVLAPMVDGPFELRLDLATGAVRSVSGFAALYAQVARQPIRNQLAEIKLDSFQDNMRRFCGDAFFARLLGALLEVRAGGTTALPWEPVPDAPRRFRLLRTRLGPQVVPLVVERYEREPHRLRDGEVEYGPRHFARGSLHQDCTKPEKNEFDRLSWGLTVWGEGEPEPTLPDLHADDE